MTLAEADGTARLLGTHERIALIAHDNRKADLVAWARFNRGTLAHHELMATGTTGGLLAENLDLPVVVLAHAHGTPA
jgi:methylglyoxal synthase